MKQNFDLHCHTTASDGTLSPDELVRLAADEGVNTIAVTDHDNVDGVGQAIEAGKRLGVTVIPGVELSIDYSPGAMHICGYFIDINNEELIKKLEFVQEARRTRNPRIVKKLNELGLHITLQEISEAAGGKQIGRPHFAQVMMQKGYVSSIQEAFDYYLAKGCPAYVDKTRLSLETAVGVIQNAGGVAVLAHPVQLKLKGDEKYEALFKKLKGFDVAGVEGYTGHGSNEVNARFTRLIRRAGMIVSAGSDFHGDIKPDVKLGQFGDNVDVTGEEIVQSLRSHINIKH